MSSSLRRLLCTGAAVALVAGARADAHADDEIVRPHRLTVGVSPFTLLEPGGSDGPGSARAWSVRAGYGRVLSRGFELGADGMYARIDVFEKLTSVRVVLRGFFSFASDKVELGFSLRAGPALLSSGSTEVLVSGSGGVDVLGHLGDTFLLGLGLEGQVVVRGGGNGFLGHAFATIGAAF